MDYGSALGALALEPSGICNMMEDTGYGTPKGLQ